MSITERIKHGEDINTEFKASFNTEVIETLVAFANAKGGTVYIGINDSGEVKRVDITSESIQQWINEVKNKTAPVLIPDAEEISVDGKSIIALFIPEYPIKPVSIRGRYFKRVKNANHQLSATEVADLHLRTINSSWDTHIDSEHTMNHISLEKVQKAIDIIRAKGRSISEDPLSFLLKYNMVKEGRPTFACYLLFKKEDCFLSTIELGFFQNEITIKDSVRSKADLLTQIDDVTNFVVKHINKEIIITGKPQHTERWQYPLEALREFILNMIVHRDYRSSADSIVKIFPNKIEFYNPGALPEDITINDLLSNNYRSNPRNKSIADFCKDLGLIEKYGSGIRRVVDLFSLENRPSPIFKNHSSGFVVTLFTDENLNNSVGTDNVTDNVTDKRFEKILQLMKINNRIKTKELSAELNVTRMTISRDIEKLKEQNKLIRIGPDKGGHWEVIE